jgi:hypothetical protein
MLDAGWNEVKIPSLAGIRKKRIPYFIQYLSEA